MVIPFTFTFTRGQSLQSPVRPGQTRLLGAGQLPNANGNRIQGKNEDLGWDGKGASFRQPRHACNLSALIFNSAWDRAEERGREGLTPTFSTFFRFLNQFVCTSWMPTYSLAAVYISVCRYVCTRENDRTSLARVGFLFLFSQP